MNAKSSDMSQLLGSRSAEGRRPTSVLGLVLVALMVLAAPVAAAESREVTAHYSGVDGNWFNPANWSTGRVPDRNTNVVLDGVDDVVIDPSRNSASTGQGLSQGKVIFQDLTVTDGARLTTLPGTVMHTRNERIGRFASVVYRSTETTGESLTVDDCGDCTLVLSPTPRSKRTVLLSSTVAATGTALPSLANTEHRCTSDAARPSGHPGGVNVQFGLGGRTPAAPGQVGRGHYATLTAEQVELGGRLSVARHHGFTPTVGDTFQVVTAGTLSGCFDNAREGDLLADFGEVGLYITYRGGDGNDVVLTAQTKEHVLL